MKDTKISSKRFLMFKERYRNKIKELLNYTNGDIFVVDVIEPNDPNNIVIGNCEVVTSCKKCNSISTRKFGSFYRWTENHKINKNFTGYIGCQICNPPGLVSKLKVGDKTINREIVEIQMSGIGRSIIKSKFILKCNWCNNNHTYNYVTVSKMFSPDNINTTKKERCMDCRFEEKFESNYDRVIGEKFGPYTIVDIITKSTNIGNAVFRVKCNCGTITEKGYKVLLSIRSSNSAFCIICKPSTINIKIPKDLDITGLKFGIFKVESYIGLNNKFSRVWRCKCNCGGVSELTTGRLSIMINKPSTICRWCVPSIHNNFKIGVIYKNRRILNITEHNTDENLITYICILCGYVNTITFSAWNSYIRNDEKEKCLNCKSITHGDTTKTSELVYFYMRWIETKAELIKENKSYDPRWNNYLDFKEDMFSSHTTFSTLKCSGNIWSKDNCWWSLNPKLMETKIKRDKRWQLENY